MARYFHALSYNDDAGATFARHFANDAPGAGELPPTSGTAPNGKPILDWDEAAAQLTRINLQWSAAHGMPATVTYAFRSDIDPSQMPADTTGFQRFTAAQIVAAQEALALWSDVANITFVRVGTGTTGDAAYSNNATILFGDFTTGFANSTGFTFYPGSTAPGDAQGDVWINRQYDDNLNTLFDGGFGAHTLEHEIGHAIGLAHPGDYDSTNGGTPTYDHDAIFWQDSRAYTVMSYFGAVNVGDSLGAFASGPQMFDIAAAQLLYGPNMTTRTGDTVYGFHSNTGHAHYSIVSSTGAPVFCIWDAGGNDTLDLSGYATNSEIDLRPESFSSAGPDAAGTGLAIGNISIAKGVVIENAIGGSGNDTITCNDANNTITGGAGDDTVITSGRGADTIMGGAGNDLVILDYSWSTTRVGSSSSGSFLQYYVGTSAAAAHDIVSMQSVDRVHVTGTALSDALHGSFGDDTINGGGGNDNIQAGDGNDILDGGDGNDKLDCGAGVDVADGGSGDDFSYIDRSASSQGFVFDAFQAASSAGTVLVDGTSLRNIERSSADFGTGDDTVIADIHGQSIYNMGAGFNRLILDHRGSDVALSTAFIETFGQFQAFDGSVYDGAANSILGTGVGAVTLYGGNAGDTLVGVGGDDTLIGGAGADHLDGGLGVDTASYASASTSDSWHRNPDGSWTITTASEGTDTLSSIEHAHFTDRDLYLDPAQQTFSGDGTSDILWRRSDGFLATWSMNGASHNGSATLGGVGNEWTAVGTGDFNGDGKDDIAWLRNDGLGAIWEMNSNSTTLATGVIGGVGTSWHVAGIGDFNADGKDDFLWKSDAGQYAIWDMNGFAASTKSVIGSVGAEWSVQAVADFNGDGSDDILWRRSDGLVAEWTTNGAAHTGSAIVGGVGNEWSIAGTGDFNGDGRADILWQRNDGLMAIWEMNGASQLASGVIGSVGTAWHVAGVGDYNGDGMDDIFWRNDSGLLAVWTMHGLTVASTGVTGSVGGEWIVI